jgi:hypothetical protein
MTIGYLTLPLQLNALPTELSEYLYKGRTMNGVSEVSSIEMILSIGKDDIAESNAFRSAFLFVGFL